MAWRNPIPVAVVIQPVANGVLLVRRDIEPKRGHLALPGGYIDFGETWREGAARELYEETGIVVDPDALDLRSVESSTNRAQMLIFCVAPALPEFPHAFEPNPEVNEIVISERPIDLAFPTHTDALRDFLRGMRR